jgi:hypothetical protein
MSRMGKVYSDRRGERILLARGIAGDSRLSAEPKPLRSITIVIAASKVSASVSAAP